MYGSTTTAHAAMKLTAALAGSVFALPATMSGNDPAPPQVSQVSAVAGIHKAVLREKGSARLPVAPAVYPAEAALPKADPPLQAARKPAGRAPAYRCEGERRCPQLSEDNRRELLVMLALWRALSP